MIKKIYVLFSVICLLLGYSKLNAQTPPYSGTIFIDPDIITSLDPSTIQSTTYTGQGERTVYDRRVNNWVTINAYLFNVIWIDGLTSEAIINPEFGNVASATVEAEKYAYVLGKLPYCLRVDVDQIWVHKGVNPFGGGNQSILIHTGQSLNYEDDGILEETFVHEASHTSLDFAHSSSPGWITAQEQDINYISTYARDNNTREDIAESFLTWMAVKYRAATISTTDYNKITQTIPNRLLYFDNQNFDMYPISGTLSADETGDSKSKISIYPNPSRNFIQISGLTKAINYKVYNLTGNQIFEGSYSLDKKIDIQNIPDNLYFLKLENGTLIKFIKE